MYDEMRDLVPSESGGCVRLMGMSDETTWVKRERIWKLAPACRAGRRSVTSEAREIRNAQSSLRAASDMPPADLHETLEPG